MVTTPSKNVNKLPDFELTVTYNSPAIDHQQQNTAGMTTSPEKPVRPEDDDCCGGGCSPCIWDTYNLQLSQWLQLQGEEALLIPEPEDETLYR